MDGQRDRHHRKRKFHTKIERKSEEKERHSLRGQRDKEGEREVEKFRGRN